MYDEFWDYCKKAEYHAACIRWYFAYGTRYQLDTWEEVKNKPDLDTGHYRTSWEFAEAIKISELILKEAQAMLDTYKKAYEWRKKFEKDRCY